MNVWREVKIEYCNELPFDIDGNKVYKIPFSVQQRMKSSYDGRP